MRVMTTGHLSPPSGPVEPGGFDFQRHAWFGQLGAVGYTRVPLIGLAVAAEDWKLWVFQIRMTISARVREVITGDVGGFAAAVTTGDRSGMSQEALSDLRASNTAHLLEISGLHMGLLSGFVFASLRLFLIFLPYLGPRIAARKIAAGGALLIAAAYLALSGGNVATERAFIMVADALIAIMLNRRAISLRAVAIAATIVLVLRPEALLGPGFQMSFAATTGLVAVFGWMRDGAVQVGPKIGATFCRAGDFIGRCWPYHCTNRGRAFQYSCALWIGGKFAERSIDGIGHYTFRCFGRHPSPLWIGRGWVMGNGIWFAMDTAGGWVCCGF